MGAYFREDSKISMQLMLVKKEKETTKTCEEVMLHVQKYSSYHEKIPYCKLDIIQMQVLGTQTGNKPHFHNSNSQSEIKIFNT